MADENVMISADRRLKEQMEQIGQWYIQHGVDIGNAQQLDLQTILSVIVREKLAQITSAEQLETNFVESFQDAINGKTYPLSTLWDDLDTE